MLKIFLTGDAHIGLQYPSWRRGTILAEARLDVFSNMVNTANDEGCNLFVIAGDLFESNDQCSRGEVQKLLDILSQFQGAVAILPGNHDYYDPKVPLWQYLREIAAAKNNILLLTNNQPYPVRVGEEWAAFYPAPCRSQHSVNGENNLAWIKAEEIPDDCNYRIGVAHGTVRGEALDNENLYFPMGRDELNRIPMDVWLLGHVHVPFPRILRVDSYTEGERIFNAGTPVQTHHNCNTEGCAFIIQVAPDKRVSAKKVVVGPYRFFARNINLEAGKMKAGLAAQLRDIPDNSVVDLHLFGAVSAEEYDHRVEIVEAATYRFFEVNYASFSLTRMLSQEDIKKNFPETSFPAQLLNALMAEPKEAQMVFELLASLKGGFLPVNIKKISCSQFAGVRDRDITLTPGLNTIYGKNESGKSTLANMLSALFFQTVKLNRQRDRAFMDASFPSDGRNSPVTGDCIDGKVSFETPDGQYVLSKDWGSDARCTLSTPKGIIKDPSRIENTLASILPYGQGVYTNMLFSSQRNADETLRTILEASQGDELKQSLANAITQAFSETDGVSTEVIEQAILQKIADIEGKHWDRVLQMPKRKSERWQTSLGTILKSYYALEDANNALTEMEQLRQAAKSVETAYASQEKAAQTAEAEYKKFRRAYDNLVSKAAREQLIEKLREEQKRAQEAALKWPQAESEIARAKTLQWERDLQEKAAKYASVKKASDEVSSLKAAAEQAVCPSEEEVKLAKDIEKVILRLESQLRGVSFSITTKPLGEHTVSIRSLCSGAPLDISVPIEEAIVLTIPGVMEICLAPAGVDTEVVSKELQNKKSSLETLLTEYRAKSADGLAQMRRDALDAQAKLDAASERLRLVLGDADFDTLKAAAQVCATSPRSIQDIDLDIRALSSSGDLTRLIAVDESLLSRYVTEYTTQVNLKEKLEQLATNLEKAESDLVKLGEIPAEYADIKNPDMYLAMLESKAKEQQKLKEAAAQAKVAAQTKLESRRVSVAGKNLTAERDQAEQEFAAQKELLAHWNHILEVFQAQKAAQASHPMEDMAARFSENLKAITGGTVDSESANKDAVDVAVYSQDRRVRYSTLSEGTKEAVSLAFRLAVLDHLFPNGGGVIIFDDPMTNMDTDRAAAACKLLKEAGTRHQIIFLTCREEYLPMLAGHEIRVEG